MNTSPNPSEIWAYAQDACAFLTYAIKYAIAQETNAPAQIKDQARA